MVNTVTQGRLLRKRKSSPHGHYICNYVMSQFDTSEITSLIQQKKKKKPLHFNQSQQRTFQLYVSVVGPKAPLTLRKTCWYIFYKFSSKNHSPPSLQFYDDFIIRAFALVVVKKHKIPIKKKNIRFQKFSTNPKMHLY